MNANVRFVIVAGLLLSAGGARAASSVTGLEGELLEGDDATKSRFSGLVTLGTQVGRGTFISNPYSDNPLFGQYLQGQVAYNLKDMLPTASSLTLTQVISWEYTQPDVPTGRHVDWADTGIALSMPKLFKEQLTGINFGGSVGVSLPISMQSLAYGKVTSTSLGLTATRSLYGFTFIGSVSGAYHFYTRSYASLSKDQVATSDEATFSSSGNPNQSQSLSPPLSLCSGALGNDDFCTKGYGTTELSSTFRLLAEYAVSEKISAGLDFRWQPSWKRAPPVNQYTSTAIDPSNRGADLSTGVLYVGYQLDDRFSLTASSGTQGPTRTYDGNGFRFPFFDTISPYNNITTFALDVNGTF